MKVTAIICEYNPFTNGHLKHLKLAREETGADTVICIMSGSFTQRGDAAILSKYQRAELAVRMGADMVVELPLIFAISPADNFAYGAVKILSTLPDIEYLSFGSECGDANLLTKVARLLSDEPTDFKVLLQKFQSDGNSFPKARSLALKAYAELNPEYADISLMLEKPNNVLGIAYIMALKKFGLDNVKLHTIKRETDYNNLAIEGDYPSASAIRMALMQGKTT
ncbi:MAG TPA: nucleotidyltransferase family protein, partial [Clostridia bacterium]|nr:nucleotidyltransferase family protein [Clostridia bacterium]